VRGPSYPERRLAQARGFHRWIMVFRFVFRCPQLGISRDAASLANWVLARKNRSAVALGPARDASPQRPFRP
jgi:hypothetical protein